MAAGQLIRRFSLSWFLWAPYHTVGTLSPPNFHRISIFAPPEILSSAAGAVPLDGASSTFDRARYKGWLRALPARRPRRRRGTTIDKSAIYPHTSK